MPSIIKASIRGTLDRLLSRLPIARFVYAERESLRARLVQTEASLTESEMQRAVESASRREIERPARLAESSKCFVLSGGLLRITADCALGNAGETLLLPFDKVMYPNIIENNGWQLEELGFLKDRINPDQRYTLLDIGANVGLFTRQVANRFPNICQNICVEADPENFRALQFNLTKLPAKRCHLWNIALSEADAEREFLRDAENIGNYSLNADAMRHRPFQTVKIRAAATDVWMREHIALDPNTRLIWKSDTQGYDEVIVSMTPLEIWHQVDMAIIELWRIKKPTFDRIAFQKRIESFPNCSIGLGGRHSVSDVMTFLDGDDWRHDDLYLWR